MHFFLLLPGYFFIILYFTSILYFGIYFSFIFSLHQYLILLFLILAFTFPLFLFCVIYCAEVMDGGGVFATKAFLAVIVIAAGFDRAFILDAGEGATFSSFSTGSAKIEFALLYETLFLFYFCIFRQGDA